MSNVFLADLAALQNLIARFRYGIDELEHIDGALNAAYYPFLETFHSSHRPRVEEAFQQLEHYIHEATGLEQSLLYGFETLLTDLQTRQGKTI
ncbi:MAG TPA: hypothetical protein VH599_12180 [Ktedonobacterales bacterium]|jgi:hypothetical protein